MDAEFVDLTAENLADEHLCCIIRTKKAHPGVEAKRRWLSDRLREGHVFRKLNAKGVVFIEYAPLETAWVPVIGDNYYYIYCLWVAGPYKGKGYAIGVDGTLSGRMRGRMENRASACSVRKSRMRGVRTGSPARMFGLSRSGRYVPVQRLRSCRRSPSTERP